MKFLSFLCLVSLSLGQVHAQALMPAPGGSYASWLTSMEEAKAGAERQERPILLLFTGSDWCPPCRRLEQQVFSQEAFKEYAAENLILLVADFPRTKQLSPEQQAANQALQRQFSIRGYPTMLVLNAKGEELHRFGYNGQNAAAFVAMLQGLKR